MKQYRRPEPELPAFNSKNIANLDDYATGTYASAHNNKMSSGSLNKYNKSPYLQSKSFLMLEIAQGFSLPKKVTSTTGNDNNSNANSRVRQQEGMNVDETK